MKMKKLLILAIVLLALLSVWQVNLVSGCELPCIDLEKTGPETAGPGETITYHFRVENCGCVILDSGAKVIDFLFGGNAIWSGVLQPGQVEEFDRTYTLPDECEDLTNTAWAFGYPPGYKEVTDESSWTVEVICPPGTGTPGYWMNHPEAWPVDTIIIGGESYDKDDAIGYMMDPVKGDKTFTMFPALVAAKLNVLIGNDDSCIENWIGQGDLWMELAGGVGNGVSADSELWQDSHGEQIYLMLDDYNNGEAVCVSSRDDLE